MAGLQALMHCDTDAPSHVVLLPLQAMPEGGICYFNCGPDSGASQPHKHLQIVPLPLATGRDAATPFCRLLDEACSAASGLMDSAATLPRAVEVRLLPFRSYATRVPPPERCVS